MQKIFTPLTGDQIKMINASVLASNFKCSQSYVSRVLKSKEEPNSELSKTILKEARAIVKRYESANPQNA